MRHTLLAMGILLLSAVAAGAEMNADEIVAQANARSYYQGADGVARAHMVVTDAQGRTRERDMTILKRNEPGSVEQKYFVYFHTPTDVRGMAYIVWKHAETDDDRWLYLPALDLVRRIAASDKRSSFAGTTFLYEDISGRGEHLDTHELISTDGTVYTVKNTPKDADLVEFGYYIVSIDKKTMVPMKAEYYDKNGRLYRTIEALEVTDIQGYPTVVKMKAADLNAQAFTITEFTGVQYDVGLDEAIFTERYLRTPPAQWITE